MCWRLNTRHPEKKRFFGKTEQSYLTQVPWLYFHGCLYFLPKLFATPTFWTPLEALFPDHYLTLTCLLCTVKLLGDPVWKEIKWQDTVLFKDANQTVSIQVGLSFSPWPRKISVWCFLPSESSKFFFQVLSPEVGRSFPNPTLFLSQNVTSLKFLCTVVVGSLFPLCLIGYLFPSCSSFSLLATFIHKSEAVWWTQPCCNLVGQVHFLWGQGVKFRHDSKSVNSRNKDSVLCETFFLTSEVQKIHTENTSCKIWRLYRC
jgi:hypothetical protein